MDKTQTVTIMTDDLLLPERIKSQKSKHEKIIFLPALNSLVDIKRYDEEVEMYENWKKVHGHNPSWEWISVEEAEAAHKEWIKANPNMLRTTRPWLCQENKKGE